jgi:hypothetical protein
LAAYRTAARLFPGLHQPVLGMGRENRHMNSYMLAEQMYLQVSITMFICSFLMFFDVQFVYLRMVFSAPSEQPPCMKLQLCTAKA